MSPLIFALVLCAAFLHAFWNFLVKGGGDKIRNMAAISIGSMPLAIILVIFFGALPSTAVPLVFVSIALHCGYQAFLAFAYQSGDLGRVYPIARGIAPLLVAFASLVLFDDQLNGQQFLGIAMIGLAIFGFVSLWGVDGIFAPATRYALITGGFIAGYSLFDGLAARIADNPVGYYSWASIGTGLVFVGAIATRRRQILCEIWHHSRTTAIIGGNASFVAYLIVVWAFTHAPIAVVTALRETSIVFAFALGVGFLGEPLRARKILAVIIIVAGVILLRLG